VQYSYARKWPKQTTRSIFLNNVPCIRQSFKCTGVKACEYLHPHLQNRVHTSVTEIDWQEIALFRQEHQVTTIRREVNR
jgi:hypothetical protein